VSLSGELIERELELIAMSECLRGFDGQLAGDKLYKLSEKINFSLLNGLFRAHIQVPSIASIPLRFVCKKRALCY
jgi:hypothetical protein